MSTPPEIHHEEFERTDALPRLDLNVLATATPINSDLLTRTDSWSFEVLQGVRWQHGDDLTALDTHVPLPRVDTSNLRLVDADFTDMITPLELGFTAAAASSRLPAFESLEESDPHVIQQIAATLDQEIVLFSEEHAASTPAVSVEPPMAKTHAVVDKLSDLAILLDTDTPSSTAMLASSDGSVDEGITWVDIPEEYTPASLSEGAVHLQRLLEQNQDQSSARARDLALKLMDRLDGPRVTSKPMPAALDPDPRGPLHSLFPQSRHEQAELLSARQTLEEVCASNELLQQAVAAAQQRVEFLKAEVERHTEIASTRDSQLATSIDELTSRRLAMRELERVIQARDELITGLRAELDALRVELQTAKDERGIMAINLAKTRERAKLLRDQLMEKNNLLQNLHGDPTERTQSLGQSQTSGEPTVELPERVLVPIDHGGPTIVLDRPTLIVGRTAQQTDICIHSSLISRQHARLIVTTEAVVVEDLNSTNGCFVNDRRIQKKLLRDSDIVTLADMKYRLSERRPSGMLTD